MENFTEGCGDDRVQGFVLPLTTKQFGVESDRCASTLGETERSIQETNLNGQLRAGVGVADGDTGTTLGVIMPGLTTTPL